MKDGRSPERLADREQLRVTHWDSELSWTVDGIDCRSVPPEIDFEQMPQRLSRVVAQFCSLSAAWTGNIPVLPHIQHIESTQYWRLGVAEGNFAFKERDITSFLARNLSHNTLNLYLLVSNAICWTMVISLSHQNVFSLTQTGKSC